MGQQQGHGFPGGVEYRLRTGICDQYVTAYQKRYNVELLLDANRNPYVLHQTTTLSDLRG